MTYKSMNRKLVKLKEENPEVTYWTETINYTEGNEPEPIDPWGF